MVRQAAVPVVRRMIESGTTMMTRTTIGPKAVLGAVTMARATTMIAVSVVILDLDSSR